MPETKTHQKPISGFAVAIIFLNSQNEIRAQLERLKMFEEIVLIDNCSTDDSLKIIKNYIQENSKQKITLVNEKSKDFKMLRYAAMRNTTKDWIFFIDMDEIISEENFYKMGDQFDELKSEYLGFWFPRRNYWGRGEEDYLHHGILYPDYQMRLIPTATLYKNTPHDEPNIDHKRTYYFKDVEIFHYQNIEKLFTLHGIKYYESFTNNYAKTQTYKNYFQLIWEIITAPIKYFLMPLTRGKGILDGKYGVLAAYNFTLQMILIDVTAIKYKMKENKVKIAIDAGNTDLQGNVNSGIQRLVYGFYKQIEINNPENIQTNFYTFGISKNENNLPKMFFSHIFLTIKTILDGNKIFIGFSGNIPRVLKYFPIKKWVFIYDFGFYRYPQYYNNPEKLKARQEWAINNSDKIFVLSKYSKSEIKKYCPNISDEKISIIYPGIDIEKSDFRPEINNYFLFVGHARPIKNIEKVLEFFDGEKQKNKTLKMVFVGGFEPSYFEKIKRNNLYKKYQNDIYIFENISNKELYGYYKYANALINFSFEEGLNFPSLEARAIGIKVITNDLDVYKEHEKLEKYSWEKFTEELLSYIID